MRGNPHGNISGFILKAVIRAVNQSSAGRITGSVTHAFEDTSLTNAKDRVAQYSTISNSFTDEDGNYTIMGLPDGTYDIHATKTDFDTTSVEGVTITAGNKKERDLVLSPLQQ